MKILKIILSFILELVVLLLLFYICIEMLLPISKTFNAQQPISLNINLEISKENDISIDDVKKEIELLVRESHLKYEDNSTSRIYNVIAIIGIFFTVFVLVVTIYQYLKSKSYENKIENLEIELNENTQKFKQLISTYNKEMKTLINTNVIFSKAQNYQLSNETYKASIELSKIIDLSEENDEIANVFDITFIKRNLIDVYKKNKNYEKAIELQSSLIDFDTINFKNYDEFIDYVDYCDFMFKINESTNNLDKYLELDKLLITV